MRGRLPGVNKDFMKKTRANNGSMQAEYDFAAMKGGVRGKYVDRYREGTNIVMLEPDIADAFPNDKAVNRALRSILRSAKPARAAIRSTDKAHQPSGRRARSKRD